MEKELKTICGILLSCVMLFSAMPAFIMTGCSQNQTNNKVMIKWLIPEEVMDEEFSNNPVNEEKLNEWLQDIKKGYFVKFITYPMESEWEDIKKIAEEEKVDIVNVVSTTYGNNPQSNIMRAISEGFCMEIEDNYPHSDVFKYDGKLYGYGDITIPSVIGISYSERYLKETGVDVETLPNTFEESESTERFLENHKGFVECGGSIQWNSGLYEVGDIFYVDQFTGECGYFFEHPKVKEMMDNYSVMIKKGYRKNPDIFSMKQEEAADIKLFTRSPNGERGVFVPRSYEYVLNNVQNIENVIGKNSVNEEDAKDFLHELYSNQLFCSYLLYGQENLNEQTDTPPGYTVFLCNENLLDSIDGQTVEEKEISYQKSCEQWKESKVEGFQFMVPEELDKTYKSIQEIICPGGGRSGEYNGLVNKPLQWNDKWNRIKEQVVEAGGDKIIEELQRQVDAYIAEN